MTEIAKLKPKRGSVLEVGEKTRRGITRYIRKVRNSFYIGTEYAGEIRRTHLFESDVDWSE